MWPSGFPACFPFLSPHCWDWKHPPPWRAFYMGSGDQTQVLAAVKQELYAQDHLPSSKVGAWTVGKTVPTAGVPGCFMGLSFYFPSSCPISLLVTCVPKRTSFPEARVADAQGLLHPASVLLWDLLPVSCTAPVPWCFWRELNNMFPFRFVVEPVNFIFKKIEKLI